MGILDKLEKTVEKRSVITTLRFTPGDVERLKACADGLGIKRSQLVYGSAMETVKSWERRASRDGGK